MQRAARDSAIGSPGIFLSPLDALDSEHRQTASWYCGIYGLGSCFHVKKVCLSEVFYQINI